MRFRAWTLLHGAAECQCDGQSNRGRSRHHVGRPFAQPGCGKDWRHSAIYGHGDWNANPAAIVPEADLNVAAPSAESTRSMVAATFPAQSIPILAIPRM